MQSVIKHQHTVYMLQNVRNMCFYLLSYSINTTSKIMYKRKRHSYQASKQLTVAAAAATTQQQ